MRSSPRGAARFRNGRWLSDKHDGPRIFVKVCQRPLARPNQIAHDTASPASTRPPVMSVFGRRQPPCHVLTTALVCPTATTSSRSTGATPSLPLSRKVSTVDGSVARSSRFCSPWDSASRNPVALPTPCFRSTRSVGGDASGVSGTADSGTLAFVLRTAANRTVASTNTGQCGASQVVRLDSPQERASFS